ncbi:apoptosis-linked gene 2-interacting protein X 1-like [Contarinia nasturtii]|uniref:apoptosis-linked gene 2-interacting protein X 1-like n=1 Tax=Contarinia nasturtii TaxID=265458 RepID=UPI0012D3C201|nr:apoptosis-linked gene 2-interacting protein X 1-like [Contarinia nasturtii]
MSTLLVVPLKRTVELDTVEPFINLFNNSYNGNNLNAIDFPYAISELSKLRNLAVVRPCIKLESLDVIYNYYDQLCTLESKLPMHKLRIPYKWKDAFGKKMFRGRSSLTISSLAYEKRCILFNIGAMQSAIAAAQGTYRDDGFKLATQLLQRSAGIFAHLKNITTCSIPEELTPDSSPEVLHVLSNLMLAQTQEIFVLKALKHVMKDSTVAKLANSCQKLYAKVLRSLEKDSVSSILEKDWHATIGAKQAGFHAICQLYQSSVCRSNKTIGEEVARLQYAVKLFKAAQSRSGKSNLYEEFALRAQRHLTESKKDNDFIYHANVPDIKSLEDVEDAQLAKIEAFTTPLSTNLKDLFVHLVPVVLHRAIVASDTRRNEFTNVEIMKLNEATQNLNGSLANLNLPAAIEVAVDSTLPRSIRNKLKDVRERGGITSLRLSMNELPKLLERSQTILNECDRKLNEEASGDKRLRIQLKEKWTRIASEQLTKNIRLNIDKYRVIIHNAIAADNVIQKLFEKHADGMEMFSKPLSELEEQCPLGNVNANCTSAQKLRKLLKKVDAIKTEREAIESELNSIKFEDQHMDMSSRKNDSITKRFSTLRKRVNESIARQTILIEHIKVASSEFDRECVGRSEARDAFLIKFAKIYDCFITLQTNIKEGRKFYKDLIFLLITFEHKVSDYCWARKTEKFNLLKSLANRS